MFFRFAFVACLAFAGCDVERHAPGRWDIQYETDTALEAIWGTSARDVWVVGDEGVVLHFDGDRWARSDVGNTWLRHVHGCPSRRVLWVADENGAQPVVNGELDSVESVARRSAGSHVRRLLCDQSDQPPLVFGAYTIQRVGSAMLVDAGHFLQRQAPYLGTIRDGTVLPNGDFLVLTDSGLATIARNGSTHLLDLQGAALKPAEFSSRLVDANVDGQRTWWIRVADRLMQGGCSRSGTCSLHRTESLPDGIMGRLVGASGYLALLHSQALTYRRPGGEWKTVEGFKELEEGRLTYYDRAAGTEHWDKVYLRDLWIAPNGTAFALLRFQKPSMERNLIVPTGCGKCRSLVVRLRLQ